MKMKMKAPALLIILGILAVNEVLCEVCPPGWLDYGGNCYYFASNKEDHKSWYNAKYDCLGKGGHLAIIRDIKERTWMESQIYTSHWIGLTTQKIGSWEWIDGTPLKAGLMNWNAGQPDNSGFENCGDISSLEGGWSDTSCYVKQPYICKRNKACQQGWLGYKDSCYYISNVQKSWGEAKVDCSNKRGQLVIIRNIEEKKWLHSKLSRTTYWIGLSSTSDHRKWFWVDETPLNPNVANWSKGQPDNRSGNENCVEMWHGNSYRWNDRNCKFNRRYICKSY
ncbi:C-type lectin domain family 6 member A-like [Stigmatopora argus]